MLGIVELERQPKQVDDNIFKCIEAVRVSRDVEIEVLYYLGCDPSCAELPARKVFTIENQHPRARLYKLLRAAGAAGPPPTMMVSKCCRDSVRPMRVCRYRQCHRHGDRDRGVPVKRKCVVARMRKHLEQLDRTGAKCRRTASEI